jgi:signal transduction histidine kinase
MEELIAHSSAPAAPDRRGGGPAVMPLVIVAGGAVGMALGAPWLGLLLSGLALLRRAMAESDAGGAAAALAALAAVGVILGGGDPAWAAALPLAATIAPRRPDAPAAAACGGALAALTVAWSPHATAALPPAVLGGMLIGAAAWDGARAGAAAFTGSWTLAAWGAGDATLAAITAPAALLWRPPRAPTGARRMPGRRALAALAILGAALLPDGATFPAMALPALIAAPALLALLAPASAASPSPPAPAASPAPPPSPPAPAASPAPPPSPPAPAASPAPPPDALDLALRTVIHDLQHTRRTMRSGADPTAALALVDRLIAGLTRYLSDRQITAPPVIVDARAALSAAAAAWTPVAQRHGIALRVRPPRAGAPLLIRADPTAVRRILDNLIDNAVRATPPGGRIELAASVAGAMALLTVSDTGCGIPPHLRDAVFRPAVTTRPDGQGLGLAIVRDLAAAMQGDVILHDRPGGGVCIGVRLPCAVAGRESVTTEATTDRRAW